MECHGLPEAARMVHLHRVGQLVNHEIAHHRRPLKEQAAVETDSSARGAAAPPRALAPHQRALIGESKLAGAISKRWLEKLRRAIGEPRPQRRLHHPAIPDVTVKRQQSVSHHSRANFPPATSDMHSPILTACRQVNVRGREWRGRHSANARFLALALYPRAMSLEEALDGQGRRSRRHHNFHATGMKNPDGQTSGALALAYYPSLGAIPVGPQRQL